MGRTDHGTETRQNPRSQAYILTLEEVGIFPIVRKCPGYNGHNGCDRGFRIDGGHIMADNRMRVPAAFDAYYTSKLRKAANRVSGTAELNKVAPGSSNSRNRRRHLRHLQDILTRDGVTHMGGVEQRHVDKAFDEIVASITPKIGAMPSPNTIRTVVTSLGNFLRWQVDHGTITPGKIGIL